MLSEHTSSLLNPLPQAVTSFVGRVRELDDVTGLMVSPGTRLVTLTGQGGAGKTRLALAVAQRLEPVFPEAIAFVPFESAIDADQVLPIIAQAIGVPDAPDQTLIQRIRIHLGQRRLLLVLDNLEHLAGAEVHVAAILQASRAVRVLCASRAPLGLAGERIYPVPPLAPSDAARLFTERARAVHPGVQGTQRDETTLNRVCEQLEYLPLAIELAAARTSVLPITELLGRLDHQLGVLTSGPRDAPARHRGMRNAIQWSYDLLGPADQQLLRQLAVFSGGFSFDAVREVAYHGVDALEEVSRLVASGLLVSIPGPAGTARFRLPVTIREFGVEELQRHGEEKATRLRHSQYFLALVETALPHYDGPDLPPWVERIVAERDNCRAAMTWAIATEDWEAAIRTAGALWRTWWAGQAIGGKAWTEDVTEGLGWIERTLPHRGQLPLASVTEALIGASALNILLGQFQAAYERAMTLLELTDVQPYPYAEFWACFQLGRLAQDQQDYHTAQSWLERAVRVAPGGRSAENHAGQALGMLADNAKALGDDRTALRLAEQGLALGRACGNPHLTSWLGLVAGRLRLKLAEPQVAASILIECAEAYAAKHDEGGVRAALTELGRVALALDQVETAKALLSAAAPLTAHEHDRPVLHAALAELTIRLKRSLDDLLLQHH